MARWGREIDKTFPLKSENLRGYHNWKAPVSQKIIQENHDDNSFQTEFIKNVLQSLEVAIEARNKNNSDCLVAAIIVLPNLFSTEICLFYNKICFDNFVNRDNEFEKWFKLNKRRNILLELGISDNQFSQLGYAFKITDDDYEEQGEIWIIFEKNHKWII